MTAGVEIMKFTPILIGMAMIFIAGCNSNEEEKVTVKTTIDGAVLRFLHNEFFTSAFTGAMRRGDVYISAKPLWGEKEGGKIDGYNRGALKMRVQEIVEEMARHYQYEVPENEHIARIQELSCNLSDEFGHILCNGRFRIGTAQKVLNLYLKYLWVAGEIPPPPHCPFDRIVIHDIMAKYFKDKDDKEVGKILRNINWTELDQMANRHGKIGYCGLVKLAEKCKGEEYASLAEWELVEYNNQ